MDDVENLAGQLIEAVRKLQGECGHVTQTLIETKAELGQLQAERDQMKAQRDNLSVEVGGLRQERDRLHKIFEDAKAA
jgi:uncharacterized coiled-coil DUF342 family protein